MQKAFKLSDSSGSNSTVSGSIAETLTTQESVVLDDEDCATEGEDHVTEGHVTEGHDTEDQITEADDALKDSEDTANGN